MCVSVCVRTCVCVCVCERTHSSVPVSVYGYAHVSVVTRKASRGCGSPSTAVRLL